MAKKVPQVLPQAIPIPLVENKKHKIRFFTLIQCTSQFRNWKHFIARVVRIPEAERAYFNKTDSGKLTFSLPWKLRPMNKKFNETSKKSTRSFFEKNNNYWDVTCARFANLIGRFIFSRGRWRVIWNKHYKLHLNENFGNR